MTDRFKYRAKLKGMDKWVCGAYLKMLPYQPNPVGRTKPLETEYKHLIITEGSADWGMPREITAYEVIPETVGQCTGLKDKNGKLIYEGDIVKFGEFYNNEWHSFDIGKVYWGGKYDYPAFELQCSTADFDMCNGLSYIFGEGLSIEVIGNIYQDSHLLDNSNTQ